MARKFVENSNIKHRNVSRVIAALGATAAICLLGVALIARAPANTTPSSVTVERRVAPEMAEVLVPRASIEQGTQITEEQFKRVSLPRESVPANAVQTFEEVKNMYARGMIVSGQPVSRDLVTQVRPTNKITTSIPNGFRAVSIRVDDKSSIEGWARAGSRVDVTWITTVNGKQTLVVVVENARVLSAERVPENNQAEFANVAIPSTATLLVTEGDANKIRLASSVGSMSLLLRGDNDNTSVGRANTTTVDDLTGARNQTSIGPSRNGANLIKLRGTNGDVSERVITNGKLLER